MNWRNAVFKRDGFTCVICGQIGHKLSAHHIKKFSEDYENRFDIDNGVTLCWSCHLNVNGKERRYESEFVAIVEAFNE
jgi:5-methylcytosine-specific restriction endonuclease McrA